MEKIITWTNDNSGFLSLILFVLALVLGWITGIFRALRNRPKLKIRLIEGPTMISTFENGREYNGHPTQITAISLYLEVINIGSAPTDIEHIEVGYHNHTVKYTFMWLWLKKRVVALSDFMISIGEDVKVYPFLEQASIIAPNQPDRYLEVGRMINGIVYFEAGESWGRGFKPRVKDGMVDIKIKVFDTFGGVHTRKDKIPSVSLSEAQRYNKNFGQTFETIRKSKEQKTEQVDGD